ncbi:MAG: DNA-directed DNA polymerase II small subunit [Thermoplasmata archaeon]
MDREYLDKMWEMGKIITSKSEVKVKIMLGEEDFSQVSGKPENFRDLFLSRYSKIKRILTGKVSISNVMDIDFIKKRDNETGTIVAMVREKLPTRYDYQILAEDPSGDIIVRLNSEMYDEILMDDIIAIRGKTRNGKFVAEDISYPGIDNIQKQEKIVKSENSIVFLSDIHVGSKNFLSSSFENFIEWINSGKENARKVKYMIVSGDLVDGIGIYPGQEKDLEIDDVYQQYEKLSEYICKIRNDVDIFMIPGNHDLTRILEPQNKPPKPVIDMFPENVKFLTNPAYLSIEDLRILVYHGASLNDVADMVRGMKYEYTDRLMIELIKRRHLAPFYGRNVPIAPLKNDVMVIEEIPDLFITGHIHLFKASLYRGILLLNASAWQKQTDYQKMMNLNPMPGYVAIKKLSSPGFETKNFTPGPLSP